MERPWPDLANIVIIDLEAISFDPYGTPSTHHAADAPGTYSTQTKLSLQMPSLTAKASGSRIHLRSAKSLESRRDAQQLLCAILYGPAKRKHHVTRLKPLGYAHLHTHDKNEQARQQISDHLCRPFLDNLVTRKY